MLYPSLDHQVHESIDLIRSQADINSLASPIFITRWIVALVGLYQMTLMFGHYMGRLTTVPFISPVHIGVLLWVLKLILFRYRASNTGFPAFNHRFGNAKTFDHPTSLGQPLGKIFSIHIL